MNNEKSGNDEKTFEIRTVKVESNNNELSDLVKLAKTKAYDQFSQDISKYEKGNYSYYKAMFESSLKIIPLISDNKLVGAQAVYNLSLEKVVDAPVKKPASGCSSKIDYSF